MGGIDIKCLNTRSNIAMIIADRYSRSSESRSHCIHWDHPILPPPLCKFYNLPILGTPWIHCNGMTRPYSDCSNVDLSTQRFTAHRLYSYALIAVRIGSSLTFWYLDSSHHHCCSFFLMRSCLGPRIDQGRAPRYLHNALFCPCGLQQNHFSWPTLVLLKHVSLNDLHDEWRPVMKI